MIRQSLNVEKWKLLELQITQTRHLYAFRMEKMSKSNTRKNEIIFIKNAQTRNTGPHL